MDFEFNEPFDTADGREQVDLHISAECTEDGVGEIFAFDGEGNDVRLADHEYIRLSGFFQDEYYRLTDPVLMAENRGCREFHLAHETG